MRWFPLFGLAPLLLVAEEPAVGVLASVRGSVTLTYRGGHTAKAHVFDWLKARTSIQTDTGARVLVVLDNGTRYEIGERSRATLERGTLRIVGGDVRRLSGLTEIPRLAAIADTPSSPRGGVVRIRGPKLQGCYPAANVTILSSQSMFSFEPVAEAKAYVVEIENSEGDVIHRAQSFGAPVILPSGILKPGSRYYWEVRSVAPTADGPQCGAGFSVLPVEDATRRAALRTVIENTGDADSFALLAEIDRRLGLLREAREEFASALKGSSAPEAIRSALQQIETLMR